MNKNRIVLLKYTKEDRCALYINGQFVLEVTSFDDEDVLTTIEEKTGQSVTMNNVFQFRESDELDTLFGLYRSFPAKLSYKMINPSDLEKLSDDDFISKILDIKIEELSYEEPTSTHEIDLPNGSHLTIGRANHILEVEVYNSQEDYLNGKTNDNKSFSLELNDEDLDTGVLSSSVVNSYKGLSYLDYI